MKLKQYLDMDWPESTELYDDVCDDTLLWRTNWAIQKQLHCWLNIYELFDRNIKIKHLNGHGFTVSFIVDDVEYLYKISSQKSKYGDTSVALFYPRNGLPVFGNIEGNTKFNDVVSGLFIATKSFIDKHNPEYIGFNTEDKDLQRIYDKLIPYIEKRLPLTFTGSEIKGKNKLYYFKVVGE